MGRVLAALAICMATALSSGAQAQSSRTIKIVVPSTAGGGADVLARMLADQIGKTQGQTFVVENRPGAGNTIGTEAVARAAPDGNTLLITTPEFVINPHLRKLNYDPLTSLRRSARSRARRSSCWSIRRRLIRRLQNCWTVRGKNPAN